MNLAVHEGSVPARSDSARSFGLAERARTIVGEDIELVATLTPDIGATVWLAALSRAPLRRGVGGDVI
jgi:hypothetical protein